jgi:hypothetical protein
VPSSFLRHPVPHNLYTLLLENIAFISYYSRCSNWWPSWVIHGSFLSFGHHPMPYPIPLFLKVTVLHYNVFTKALYNQTSNWLLVGKCLHSMHCYSTRFPHQALERRKAQETLKRSAGLHNIKKLRNHWTITLHICVLRWTESFCVFEEMA